MNELVKKLISERSLSEKEYCELLSTIDDESTEQLRKAALEIRHKIYGNEVFLRGLIEISNYCKNDCLYCGIRRSNRECERYRLTKAEIFECCDEGYALGLRTFVMQGGEDVAFNDELCVEIIKEIKRKYPDCAVTLSLGERSRESYKKLKEAGADRYLLRHETADKTHYETLHPKEMSFENRFRCLRDLRELGFAVGCGIMVGSPNQTNETIAKDLKFIETFCPEMCGIGPFIPHSKTPFAQHPQGSVILTCLLLSIVRIICPSVLLPATTALSTAKSDGREKGILCGANVVMPNLSPISVRKKYMLYNKKLIDGSESAQSIKLLNDRLEKIGYKTTIDRGDNRKEKKNGSI